MLALFEKVLYIYEVITFDCKENGTYMRRIIIMKEKVVLAYSCLLYTSIQSRIASFPSWIISASIPSFFKAPATSQRAV